MISAEKLLPSNATPLERAMAEVLSSPVDAEVRDFVRALTTPGRWLPFLAGHESVDLWFEDWSDTRKRQMIADATALASIKGTRAALPRFLAYVDAEIVDRVSHPRRFIIGRGAIGVDPIGHKAFVAHLLVRVPLKKPRGAFVVGFSSIGRDGLVPPDLRPLERVRRAAVVAKAPETLVTINHAHRRHITLDEGFPLDGTFALGNLTNRKRL